ncbi:unnamed protein product, partial [Gulo gulo]
MVLLIAMAFDRHVAICKPLHYLTVMTPQRCILFLVASWIIGLIHSVTQLAFVVDLPFCGPNELDSFFWTFLSLSDLITQRQTHWDSWLLPIVALFLWPPFLIIIISYTFILVTVQKKIFGEYVQGPLHSGSSCHRRCFVLWAINFLLCVAI